MVIRIPINQTTSLPLIHLSNLDPSLPPILEQESQKKRVTSAARFRRIFHVICVLLPRLSLNLYELRPMIYHDLFFGSPDFHRLFFPTPLRVARVDKSTVGLSHWIWLKP